mgnify:CR=1 FL=1
MSNSYSLDKETNVYDTVAIESEYIVLSRSEGDDFKIPFTNIKHINVTSSRQATSNIEVLRVLLGLVVSVSTLYSVYYGLFTYALVLSVILLFLYVVGYVYIESQSKVTIKTYDTNKVLIGSKDQVQKIVSDINSKVTIE